MTLNLKRSPSTSPDPLDSSLPLSEHDIDTKPVVTPLTPPKKAARKRKSPAKVTWDGGSDTGTTPSLKKARSPKQPKGKATEGETDADSLGKAAAVSVWTEAGWSADKREAFIARLIGDGVKLNKVDDLAGEVREAVLLSMFTHTILGEEPASQDSDVTRCGPADGSVQSDHHAGQVGHAGWQCQESARQGHKVCPWRIAELVDISGSSTGDLAWS